MKATFINPFLSQPAPNGSRSQIENMIWQALKHKGNRVMLALDGEEKSFPGGELHDEEFLRKRKNFIASISPEREVEVKIVVWNSTMTWNSTTGCVCLQGKRTSISRYWSPHFEGNIRGFLDHGTAVVEETTTPWLPWWETMEDFVHRCLLAQATVEGCHKVATLLGIQKAFERPFPETYDEIVGLFGSGHDYARAYEQALEICREAVLEAEAS